MENTVSLTKADIIEEVAENRMIASHAQAHNAVEDLLEIIKSTLASGEDVMVSGFGKFCVNEKKPRKGRNPATGESMMLRPRKVVTFKCSEKLRTLVNN